MHDLEYALLALAVIEEKVKKNVELAEELLYLASISHGYEAPKEILPQFKQYIKNMHRRADHIIQGKSG